MAEGSIKPLTRIPTTTLMHLKEVGNTLRPNDNMLTQKLEYDYSTPCFDPDVLPEYLRSSLHPCNNGRRPKSLQYRYDPKSYKKLFDDPTNKFLDQCMYQDEVEESNSSSSEDVEQITIVKYFTLEKILVEGCAEFIQKANRKQLKVQECMPHCLTSIVAMPKHIFFIPSLSEFYQMPASIFSNVLHCDPKTFDFKGLKVALNHRIVKDLEREVGLIQQSTFRFVTAFEAKLVLTRNVDYLAEFLAEIERFITMYYSEKITGSVPGPDYDLEIYLNAPEAGRRIYDSIVLIINDMTIRLTKDSTISSLPDILKPFLNNRKMISAFIAKLLAQISGEQTDDTELKRKQAGGKILRKFMRYFNVDATNSSVYHMLSGFNGGIHFRLGSLSCINALMPPQWLVTYPEHLPKPTVNRIPLDINLPKEPKGLKTRPSWGLNVPSGLKAFFPHKTNFPIPSMKPFATYPNEDLTKTDDIEHRLASFVFTDSDEYFAEIAEIFSYTDRYLFLVHYKEYRNMMTLQDANYLWGSIKIDEKHVIVDKLLSGICTKPRYLDRLSHLFTLLYILEGAWIENTTPEEMKATMKEATFLFLEHGGLLKLTDRLAATNIKPKSIPSMIREHKVILTIILIVLDVIREEQADSSSQRHALIRTSVISLITHQETVSKNTLLTVLFNFLYAFKRNEIHIPIKRVLLAIYKLLMVIVGGFESYRRVKEEQYYSYQKSDTVKDKSTDRASYYPQERESGRPDPVSTGDEASSSDTSESRQTDDSCSDNDSDEPIPTCYWPSNWPNKNPCLERDYLLLKLPIISLRKKPEIEALLDELRDATAIGPSKVHSPSIERFYYTLFIENSTNVMNLLQMLSDLQVDTDLENHKLYNEVFHVFDVPFRNDTSEMKLMLKLDCVRHREIMFKTVSGLLLLLAKFFKLNHYPQFEHFTQMFFFNEGIQNYLKQMHKEKHPYISLVVKDYEYPKCVSCWRSIPHFSENTPIKAQPTFSWRKAFTNNVMLRMICEVLQGYPGRILLTIMMNSMPSFIRLAKVPNIFVKYYALKLLKMQCRYLGAEWRMEHPDIVDAITEIFQVFDFDDWHCADDTQLRPWHYREHEIILSNYLLKYVQRNYSFDK